MIVVAVDASSAPATSRQRTEDLIVRAILLDHVNDVFDQTGFTNSLWDGSRKLVCSSRFEGLIDPLFAHVARDHLRQLVQLALNRNLED